MLLLTYLINVINNYRYGGDYMKSYIGLTGRIYPNNSQKKIIHNTAHHSRFVWNEFLSLLSSRYNNNKNSQFLSHYSMNILLTQLKKEHAWLKQAESSALQNSLKTLYDTFQKFFKKQCGYPQFKKRNDNHLSYTSTIRGKGDRANIRFNGTRSKIHLPKVGWLRVHLSRTYGGQPIKSVTVRTSNRGYYEISVLVEHENQVLPKTGKSIGVDVGLIDLATLSNGEKLNLLGVSQDTYNKMTEEQRKLSRMIVRAKKNHGENWYHVRNIQKQRAIVSRLHKKLSNHRKDGLHKITKYLIEEYDVIVIEDLDVSNMMMNHNMAKSIANASWRMFRTFLEYKCTMYGKTVISVPPHYTSTTCSTCGLNGGNKPLNIREWVCEKCNTLHDRDINAAINILNKGLSVVG